MCLLTQIRALSITVFVLAAATSLASPFDTEISYRNVSDIAEFGWLCMPEADSCRVCIFVNNDTDKNFYIEAVVKDTFYTHYIEPGEYRFAIIETGTHPEKMHMVIDGGQGVLLPACYVSPRYLPDSSEAFKVVHVYRDVSDIFNAGGIMLPDEALHGALVALHIRNDVENIYEREFGDAPPDSIGANDYVHYVRVNEWPHCYEGYGCYFQLIEGAPFSVGMPYGGKEVFYGRWPRPFYKLYWGWDEPQWPGVSAQDFYWDMASFGREYGPVVKDYYK